MSIIVVVNTNAIFSFRQILFRRVGTVLWKLLTKFQSFFANIIHEWRAAEGAVGNFVLQAELFYLAVSVKLKQLTSQPLVVAQACQVVGQQRLSAFHQLHCGFEIFVVKARLTEKPLNLKVHFKRSMKQMAESCVFYHQTIVAVVLNVLKLLCCLRKCSE